MPRHLTILLLLGSLGCDPTGPGTVTSVELSPETLTLGPAETALLDAVVRGNGGTVPDIGPSWRSDDPLVATVNPAGQVLGVGYGTTRIIATVLGVSDTAIVTVTATQPAHLAAWWRMHSFDAKIVPATYWSEDDALLDDGTTADVVIRLDSAKMQLVANGDYSFRQYCFTETHDGVVKFRYCWGDHGKFTFPQPGTLSFVSEYIENLSASGTVTHANALALTEPLVVQETPRQTVWHRAP